MSTTGHPRDGCEGATFSFSEWNLHIRQKGRHLVFADERGKVDVNRPFKQDRAKALLRLLVSFWLNDVKNTYYQLGKHLYMLRVKVATTT